MFIIIGWGLALAAIVGGFLFGGGHLGVFVQPSEFIIILGAAIGAFLAANKPVTLSALGGAVGAAFKGSKYTKDYYLEALTLMFMIFTKIRTQGLLALEADLENPHSSDTFKVAPNVLHDHHAIDFIVDYLRMMSAGNISSFQMSDLMDAELEMHHHAALQPVGALNKLADGLPAFGIVAAVMGVVHTMESVGIPPAELGKLIAAALVGTFLGILVSYGFVGPLATSMEGSV